MDFLDPKKKRAHKIRLYIGYGLVAIALVIATLILMFAAYGYDIDRKTGTIIQNGLILVDAKPESATILVNGENKGTTDSRLVLPADSYTIELQRDGYLPWKRDVNLAGSSIEHLAYPFMYPAELQTANLQTYGAVPTMASSSPDRRWLVVAFAGMPGAFQVVDLNDQDNPAATINLPAALVTQADGVHNFEAIEWSSDNDHLLIKHTFAGGSEFIMLQRSNPANSLNISKTLPDQRFTDVSLRDKKADQLYLFNAPEATLVAADTTNATVSLLKTGVLAYKTYEQDTVMYVTAASGAVTAQVHVVRGNQDYVLRSVPVSPTYLLDMARFDGQFYLVSGSTADGRVYVYKDPFADLTQRPSLLPQPVRVLVLDGAEHVSFSAIARFIAVQAGSRFAVYDAETERQYRYDTKLDLATPHKAVWMDGHRLLLNSKNSVQAFDFDGTNLHQLSPSLNAFTPFFDRDYKALFTFAPALGNPAQTALTRTELRAPPPN